MILKTAIFTFISVKSSFAGSAIFSLQSSKHSFSYCPIKSLKGTLLFQVRASNLSAVRMLLRNAIVSSAGLLNTTSFGLIGSFLRNSVCMSQTLSICSCQTSNAFFKISSGTSFASHSIILILHFFPATSRFNKLFSSSALLGLMINFPSIYPICAAPTGPSNGIPDARMESDAPTIAITPKGYS